MPEGPSMAYLRERCKPFVNQTITHAHGYAKIPINQYSGKKITGFKTHGKEFFILVDGAPTIRIHLMLFGNYLINDRKEGKNPTLSFEMQKGELNFYVSNIKTIDGDIDDYADPSIDVMNKKWDEKAAFEKVKDKPDALIADVLLDQAIFAGVGNKIKDEVLWQVKVQPESTVNKIPDRKLKEIIKSNPPFADMYFKWKHEPDMENPHLEIHYREQCPRDDTRIKPHKIGKAKRTAYFCPKCQKLY